MIVYSYWKGVDVCGKRNKNTLKLFKIYFTCLHICIYTHARVDGLRVRYWYIQGLGNEQTCYDGDKNYDYQNDMSALCRHMWKAHGLERELWAAFVSDVGNWVGVKVK